MLQTILRCACTLSLAAAALAAVPAWAQIERLPESSCAEAGASGDGFEELALSWPSLGSGGFGGSGNAFVAVPGYESLPAYAHREYFWFVPEQVPLGPMPVVVLLHGTAGSPANARSEARTVRDLWRDAASAHGFAVIAPIGGSSVGSWVVPETAGAGPSDYDVIAAVIADLESRHNIERARRYLWGFSAGAHVALDVVLNPFHAGFGRRQFAAVAANAGALAGLACTGMTNADCDAQMRAAFPRLPVQMLVGTLDPLRNQALADGARFLSQGWTQSRDYQYVEFSGGHWVDPPHAAVHWAWLCQFARRLDPIERFRLRPLTP